jgi:hypothetical protein
MSENTVCAGCYINQPICVGCYIRGEFSVPYSTPISITSLWEIPTNKGLTDQEKEILFLLADAWNKFQAIEGKHPDDNRDFLDGIHNLQRLIGVRVARRVDVDVWNQYERPKGE